MPPVPYESQCAIKTVMKKIVLAFIIISSFFTTIKSQNCSLICNGDFENPVIGHWTFIADTLFQCWKTTESDSILEIWWTGYNGVPAYHGNQFNEMDAWVHATIYQNFTVAPGTNTTIGFAHRGRAGVDTMSLSIGPVGGPYVTLGKYADGNVNWGYYTVNYTIPAGFGSYYSLRFNSIYNAGGNPGLGNFLDDVSMTGGGGITVSITYTNVTCNNAANGSAIANASSGISPYTYQWSPSGGTSMMATGLSAGTYTCVVTDAHGCIASEQTVIGIDPTSSQSVSISGKASVCSGISTTLCAEHNRRYRRKFLFMAAGKSYRYLCYSFSVNNNNIHFKCNG